MSLLKLLVTIAVTTAVTVALITTTTTTTTKAPAGGEDRNLLENKTPTAPAATKTKPSRFLAQMGDQKSRNPNAADHCNKKPEVCGGGNSTACCNNKCVDLAYDDHNCGACKNKCKFSQTCCRGQCVYLAYDKRHCGQCNHRCPLGEFCVYGLCNYA